MQAYLALPIVIIAGFLIVKKYNTQAVLFSTGLLMMLLGVTFGAGEFLPNGVNSSGSVFFDFFLTIKSLASSNMANLGLIIMSVGGFAKYMDHIGAADSMVRIATKPLSKFSSPYIVLALAYILGQILNIFIPSAVGLAMLLLVALFPVLVRIGCTPASTAAVLATTACLDLGPGSGNSNRAAEVIGIDAASYFVEYQMLAAPVIMIVIAILHYFTQKYFDKKDSENGVVNTLKEQKTEDKGAPIWFAILPVMPLAFLLIFSRFAIDSINVDVVTAMFVSLFIAMVANFIVTRDGHKVADSIKVYLKGMGDVFASVVSLIIAAQTFVAGLAGIGFISLLLSSTANLGLGILAMTIIMVTIIGLTAVLSGSGNAAFFSFSSLAPDLAVQTGGAVGSITLSMQLTAGIMRSVSPVAGVVIACAGVAGISPTDVAKRTAIPMIGGVVTLLIMSVFV
ncbi:C4-dicarboxylate transporter DcuC [Endozoicomonas lisbonensis]|uniref:DcuC family C4-dicarboxylate transporter n=1 Tax=Endozoicomonas lisbonensis TaxID=3120522 RepID=A0ABV2SEI7_9GAMM